MTYATLRLVMYMFAAAGPARAPDDPELVQYAAIERAIRVGALDDAAAQLSTATLDAPNRARLEGLLALARGDAAAAARAFTTALAAHDDPPLRLHLAQAELALGHAEAAARALVGTEALATTTAAQPLLQGRVALALGHDADAYAAFVLASRNFPDEPTAMLELVALCADRGLDAAARAWAGAWLALPETAIDRAGALVVLSALHRDRAALPLLESIALRFPGDAEVIARLAHAWAAAEYHRTAAGLFERAARRGGDTWFAAADQYRMAGATERALAANARVRGDATRLDQRASILFAAGRHARVVALAPALARAGVSGPATRLRLAHAHYALGQYAQASSIARSLLGGALEGPARALLAATGRIAEADDAPASDGDRTEDSPRP